jgi:hypothetical protein
MDKVTVINPDEFPPFLHDLIPIAETWAIRKNTARDELLENAPEESVRRLVDVVANRRSEIDRWLDSLPKDVSRWPKAAVDFLYLVKTWHEAACWISAEETPGHGPG